MKLTRELMDPFGIISTLRTDFGSQIAITLEHSYDGLPKIPPGVYKCVRGIHALEHYNKGQPFETFEVTGIEGHTGLLFHPGNKNADSNGCVLTGRSLITGADGHPFVTNSHTTFDQFMKLNTGVNEFNLTVE